MSEHRATLIVLAGPTASGKSAMAMALAERLPITLVCADSRTVYRGFDIGTAKPSVADRERVQHELIDIADPTETYTAARFRDDAGAAVEAIRAAGRIPLVVGGTGFYIRALAGGLSIPEVPPQPELRRELEALADPHGELAKVDPSTADRLHPNDRIRIVRALEVQRVLGRPLSEAATRVESPHHTLTWVLTPSRDVLETRIRARLDGMLAGGLVEEVEGLRARHGRDLPLLGTLGYREVGDWLDGRCSRDEAREAIAVHTRQFARRQLTWFRREPVDAWFEDVPTGADFDACIASIRTFVEQGGRA